MNDTEQLPVWKKRLDYIEELAQRAAIIGYELVKGAHAPIELSVRALPGPSTLSTLKPSGKAKNADMLSEIRGIAESLAATGKPFDITLVLAVDIS